MGDPKERHYKSTKGDYYLIDKDIDDL